MSERVAAIVLAAGASTRLGRPKQLVIVHGETLLSRAVRAAHDANCSPIVVVLGANADAIQQAVPTNTDDVLVVTNLDWEAGMGGSVAVGARHLQKDGDLPDAVALLLCDQPLVTAESVRALIATRRHTQAKVAASEYDANGTIGVPCVFDGSMLKELAALSGATGAKPILQKYRALGQVTAFPFPPGALDIDTPDDLVHLLEMLHGTNEPRPD